MTEWIFSLMLLLVPASPASESFLKTAKAFNKVAHESPIYENNPVGSVLELMAVSFFESHFDPNAVHADAGGDSIGLAQINVSNLAELGLKREDLFDPETNLRAAAKLMRESHRTCRGFPALQQLAAYATGRGLCSVEEGINASRNRLKLARKLLAEHPPFWVSSAESILPVRPSTKDELETAWVARMNGLTL
jgi:hypothetical protein